MMRPPRPSADSAKTAATETSFITTTRSGGSVYVVAHPQFSGAVVAPLARSAFGAGGGTAGRGGGTQ
ncbi:hypothetical protein ACFVXC_22785 [Streptomyces sp. NPDC058257]|uniref:hypothetical protein n=1 Tax=Streptomyces sp. NPDC058257 TaxID=3346409 RepID=UPI0036EBC683